MVNSCEWVSEWVLSYLKLKLTVLNRDLQKTVLAMIPLNDRPNIKLSLNILIIRKESGNGIISQPIPPDILSDGIQPRAGRALQIHDHLGRTRDSHEWILNFLIPQAHNTTVPNDWLVSCDMAHTIITADHPSKWMLLDIIPRLIRLLILSLKAKSG